MNKLFIVFDKVKNLPLDVAMCPNHQTFIRESAITLCGRIPLKDLELREVATVLDNGCLSLYDSYIIRNWNDYKFPETRAEALAPLGSDVASAVVEFESKSREEVNA